MRTDGLLFLDRNLLQHIKNDKSISQVANVAWPGSRALSAAALQCRTCTRDMDSP
jgi:hypothetical protein